jgi:hypothetical protein
MSGVLAAGILWVAGCSSSKPSASTTPPPGESAPIDPPPPSHHDAGDASDADADDAGDAFPPFQCLDDKPAPVDAGVDAGSASCPPSGSCAVPCAHVLDHYKLGVRQVAIRCINKLPSCDNANDVRTCVDDALLATCADPTSPSYCAGLVTQCDPNAGKPGSNIDEAGCESFANGLSASGRTSFSDCINQKVAAGTCPMEVVTCADQIRM